VASKELGKVITLKPAKLTSGKRFDKCRGKLEFQGLSFRYPSRPDFKTFDDFNLILEPGKTTAIVGPSGSGKSTLVHLIERWYEPECGRILLDDEPIKDLDECCYRSQIGLVQQVGSFQSRVTQCLDLNFLTRIQIFSMTPCSRT